ncbi:MAG: TRAP transporter large permease [Limimaricola soesokkakensis]|uniref:TRAP transporter large permease protein n=6 Tax=Limimaricola TaxID=2211638 RepID=A0A1X6ZAX1_9RHOB|nr:TRAP transporter large permease subunit [Limimaricola soesokkakensis]PSK86444.1 tripartite ATP-independent transporter DctM subunit [Limimaricola soesokkakensis]SLN45765.1 Sialic acid TRAP transporter permease protein SiaT [Limimaricola soesokkakensis]
MEFFGLLQGLGIEGATGLMFAMLLVLLVTGIPLAYVTLLVALIFALGWFGPMAVPLITSRVYSFVSSFVFVSVPMFVLMAAILDRSGIARDLFDAMRLFGGRLRGGIAIQTILVAVILAAMSGIIGGEVVLLGLIALPQMLRLGYDKNLAIGVVCAGGALGTMVPPSIVLIIYGLTANVSIGDLFTAAFIPGLMLAGFYVAYVLIRAYLNPAMAPVVEGPRASTAEKLRLAKGLFLPILVVIGVLGSIYGGIASVTEASAVGVLGVTLSTMIRGEFTIGLMKAAALQTLQTVGMIVWIGIGATALVGVFNLMGGIKFVSALITGISDEPVIVLLFMMALLFVLGMFLDWVGIALLTMPIFVPIITSMGYDPVWFGVVFCMNMQMSFLSPPFGPAAFYLKSVAPPDISLGDIFRSLLPFIGLQALAVAVLILFPAIAIY